MILKPTEEMSAQLTISKLNIAAKDHSLFQLSL
ncbi:methyl-accepting chemotaxis protein [Vibrio cholerae]|nr:methyl-accepting chemotaxis protein [Vibrio cholerae]